MTGLTWVAWRHQRWVLISSVALVAGWAVLTAQNSDPDVPTLLQERAGEWGTPAYFVPVVLGMFWAAPLLARELQTGTIDLAYSQSVSRWRWLVARVVPLLVLGPLTMLAVLAALYWATPADYRFSSGAGFRSAPIMVGFVLFTIALGLLAGALFRRTVPAMAVAFAGLYVVTAYAVEPVADLVPFRHADLVMGGPAYKTLTSSGGAFRRDELLGGGMVRVTYLSHQDLWTIQWLVLGFLALAAAVLLGVTFWWMTRREPRS